MGITLTGKAIKDTYEGLLKFTDNLPVNSTSRDVTDGYGNATALKLASNKIEFIKGYTTQSIAEINADSDLIVPSKEWVTSQLSTSNSFIALTDTPSQYVYWGKVVVNEAKNGLTFMPEYYDFACGDETSDIGVGQVIQMEFPRAMPRVMNFDFTVSEAPTGSPMLIDVLLNGVTVLGSQKYQIDAGNTTTVNQSLSGSISGSYFDINQADILSVNVTQVGSTNPGVALKGFMNYNHNIVM